MSRMMVDSNRTIAEASRTRPTAVRHSERAYQDPLTQLSHAELETIFLHVVDGIVVADEEGLVVAFNPAAERIFVRRKRDVIGRNIKLLMADDVASAHDHYVRHYLQGHEAGFVGKGPREVLAKRGDGTLFYADIAISEARTERGRRFIAIVRDISERRARELQLREAKARAEEASAIIRKSAQSKSRMLSGVTHEFRTPLNAIIGFSEALLLDGERPLDVRQRDYVGYVLQSGEHLLELVNNFLELARQEDPHFEVAPRPLELRPFLTEMRALHQPAALTKGLALELIVEDDVPGEIVIDVRCLRHTLTNLLSNALKFTDRGYVRVAVEFRHGDSVGDHLCLTVSDTGIGLAEENAERIFEPFAQIDDGLTRSYGGTGLGLAICRRLSSLMGGTIHYHPNVPHGARFVVEVPVTPVSGLLRSQAHTSSCGCGNADKPSGC